MNPKSHVSKETSTKMKILSQLCCPGFDVVVRCTGQLIPVGMNHHTQRDVHHLASVYFFLNYEYSDQCLG
jgi:hypothetical protein